MDQKYIVALELSGTQVKGAVASIGKHPNGSMAMLTIDAIVTEDNTDCVQYGRVQNLINAAKLTNHVLNRLQNEPVLNHGTINGAYIAMAGRSLSSEFATTEITLPTEMVITNEILRNLYIEASKLVSPNKKVLKVLPRKYMVDNQAMPNPVGALGQKLRGDFTLVTCNPINQRNLELVFSDKERVNLPIVGTVVTPLAIADMVLDEEEKQLGCVLVDLGAQTTTISIYKDRALQYLATLPMGSQNITRDISVGMNVTMEKAETVKCSHGDATAPQTRSNDDLDRMNSYVAARAYEIVANINAMINYAKYKPSDLPEGFILTGRGARLKNFDALLASQSKMRVRNAKVPTNISFALNTTTYRPDDYLSLIALLNKVSLNPGFHDCVTFDHIEQPEVKITEPVKEVEEKVITTPDESNYQPEQPNINKRNKRLVDDDNWAQDDQLDEVEQEIEEKPKKKKVSYIDLLRSKVINIISSSEDINGDADIE